MRFNKNAIRLLFITTLTLFIFCFFKLSLSYETTIDDNLRLTLPAAVYISPDRRLSFDYPDIFQAYAQTLPGSEISYHVDLLTRDQRTHGYVEVWNLKNESLSVFLEKAKAAFSTNLHDFKETFPSGDVDSREWSYTVDSENSGAIQARQYFSKNGDNMIVVSLFAPKSIWSSKYDSMFTEIKNSTRLL